MQTITGKVESGFWPLVWFVSWLLEQKPSGGGYVYANEATNIFFLFTNVFQRCGPPGPRVQSSQEAAEMHIFFPSLLLSPALPAPSLMFTLALFNFKSEVTGFEIHWPRSSCWRSFEQFGPWDFFVQSLLLEAKLGRTVCCLLSAGSSEAKGNKQQKYWDFCS